MPGGRLSRADRERIEAGLARGATYSEMARELDRPVSTVTREIGRNGGVSAYRADHAQALESRRLDIVGSSFFILDEEGEQPRRLGGETPAGPLLLDTCLEVRELDYYVRSCFDYIVVSSFNEKRYAAALARYRPDDVEGRTTELAALLARVPEPSILVIFGGTGDLTTHKLMPAIYDLARQRLAKVVLEFFAFTYRFLPPGCTSPRGIPPGRISRPPGQARTASRRRKARSRWR